MKETDLPFYRLVFFAAIVVATGAFLLGRAATLQLFLGNRYSVQAEENRLVIRRFHPPRGIITDRNGVVLVRNAPAFRLVEEGKEPRLVSNEEALAYELRPETLEGVVEIDARREYPESEIFAHAFGYVSEVNKEELERPEFSSYVPGDRVGRLGLEAMYEPSLRGVVGRALVEADAIGQRLRVISTDQAVSGKTLVTTLDASLQRRTYELLKRMAEERAAPGAAAVLMDARDGSIRAMVSFPSFDPKILIRGEDEAAISSLLSDPNFPMVNRTIGASYPPASTFKIVTSLAGLTSGKVNADTLVEDTGEIRLGPYVFSNWYFTQYGKKEGFLTLVRAMSRSNDIFFYRVAQWVEHELISTIAEKFGFGEKSGIDLPGEVRGLVPNTAWKRKVKGEPWLPGNTLHLGIGQGDMLATPLQIAAMTAGIATEGKIPTPHLGERLIDPATSKEQVLEFPTRGVEGIDASFYSLIREGMVGACSQGGTAWPFFSPEAFPVSVACKTGTAEFGDPANRTHAWFTAFAPAENPEVVVTVVVEASGEGSSVAAPVAKAMLAQYFGIELPKDKAKPADAVGD
ncbi:MAG: penicillin-binding transpeptidase domain-containing protein [bacterium]|nr:penicillin-binding transpeptidase domain-containing protein [bacterium]